MAAACGSDADDFSPVITQHTALVRACYDDTLRLATALDGSLATFIAAPSEATLGAAREAYLAARVPYAQTEAFRFYGGPIDDPDTGPEGRINAWPLDEAYIDYVEGSSTSGIIGGAEAITRALLVEANERNGEKNISTGYHAIEFLLWGQDRSETGPGVRPFTDYTTAPNAERRKQYLTEVSALLVADLTSVRDAWAEGQPYPSALASGEPAAALQKILTGMGALSGAELSGERMTVAYDNKDQEDEHSCFSDSTHADLANNGRGIQNVWLGRYGALDGPGIDELVRARDAALAARLTAELEASVAALSAIPAPFDQAIVGADDAPGRTKIKEAIDALKKQADSIVDAATSLGVTLSLE